MLRVFTQPQSVPEVRSALTSGNSKGAPRWKLVSRYLRSRHANRPAILSLMEFSFAPEDAWIFQSAVEGTRRAALWNTPFDEIIDLLVAGLSIETLRRTEPSRSRSGLSRLSVLLSAPTRAVDLFHNGRGGYRAQYLASVANGNDANEFAFKRILGRVAELRNGSFGPSREKAYAGAHAYGGKLWIKEGSWIRPARRELVVPLWQERRPIGDVSVNDAKRKVRYGAAAPQRERRIALKGEWIDHNGDRSATPMKQRGEQIHLYGFT